MTKLLQIQAHYRRSPVDRYAEIKAATTEKLRQEVLIASMCREIEQTVEVAVAVEGLH